MSRAPSDPPPVNPASGAVRVGTGPDERDTFVSCDAILFDMDGTLVDSRAIVERLWLRWAGEHLLSADAVLAVAHGRRTLETMQLVAPHLATVEEAARLDALEALEEGDETQIPGAAALLASLPADRWAVVTSAGGDLARARLGAVGLPLPITLIGADGVTRGKPDPEGYLEAARALGVSPSRAVVFEDTPAGAEAGRAAGALVIGLRTTFPHVDGCDVLVPNLEAVRLVPPLAGSALRLALRGAAVDPDRAGQTA